MNRLLMAVVLAALSTPALARGEPGPDNHSYTQPAAERHQKQSKPVAAMPHQNRVSFGII